MITRTYTIRLQDYTDSETTWEEAKIGDYHFDTDMGVMDYLCIRIKSEKIAWLEFDKYNTHGISKNLVRTINNIINGDDDTPLKDIAIRVKEIENKDEIYAKVHSWEIRPIKKRFRKSAPLPKVHYEALPEFGLF